jgi:hypothetical protein
MDEETRENEDVVRVNTQQDEYEAERKRKSDYIDISITWATERACSL